MGTAEAEQALTEWKRRTEGLAAERNELIRAAHAAGVSITRINELTGLSRVTVYKILGLGEDA
jgi:transcriptional regulator of acetoin/glycerol metabolism